MKEKELIARRAEIEKRIDIALAWYDDFVKGRRLTALPPADQELMNRAVKRFDELCREINFIDKQLGGTNHENHRD